MTTWMSVSQAVAGIALGLGSWWYSRRAAKLSQPTGNGWAGDVVERLERIETCQNGLQNRLTDHLEFHLKKDKS